MIVTIVPTILVTSSFLSLFCRYIETKNKNQIFSKLVVRYSFAFCLKCVALYFKEIPNSTDFYKKNFLHVIPARIIVPGLNQCIITLQLISNTRCAVCHHMSYLIKNTQLFHLDVIIIYPQKRTITLFVLNLKLTVKVLDTNLLA